MAEVSNYAPGRFCWQELATTDQEGAKKFYGELLGWGVNDIPLEEGYSYSMFQLKGKSAAGAFVLGDEQEQQGIPPHWNLYVAVENVDEIAERAKELGGNVIVGPMDVFEQGRTAMLQDPTGAMLGVWQPKAHIGSQIIGEPGATMWNELMTTDVPAAGNFYTQLFGWERDVSTMNETEYTVFMKDGEQIAGMMQKPEGLEQVPSHWMIYFGVANCDASVEKVRSLGGQVTTEPFDIPDVGRIAVIQDPQGAVCCIMQSAQPQEAVA